MIDILMPRLSDTMTEGAISAWLKKPGDAVSPGDILVEIETDKALMEQEAYDAGILAEILVAEGENVAIGTPIARLDNGMDAGRAAPTTADDVEVEAAEPSTPTAAAASLASKNADAEAPVAGVATPPSRLERRRATPLVRRIAKERGIDLGTVTGSGPGGRIVRADLDALAAESAQAEADVPHKPSVLPTDSTPIDQDERESRSVPFDAVRQSIASRLTESSTTIPTFAATASADITELLALRAQINEAKAEDGVKLSLNDFLIRASALALRAHPEVNASYSAEGRGATLLHGRVYIGVAVASPAGLVVPVVRDADRMSVATIAATSRDLISRAADRKLTPRDMSNGTFTVSNLGMYGVEQFSAIINPPQGAILAIGAARDELALVNGELTSRARLKYTITADHRIVDGALAAQFLATLTSLLEAPMRIIA
ncbi:dihydrolipoamide acetyltransferase family protein [Gryllotalpicola koreensis]|uniref:Dihydrolipoamide acetyltransferase component of pyruvate dehydrogenase complex n=1 Tax=Gryllotalpicola koreensis TaxID=993086 RepID=A0ABP8A5C5_9MICO